MRRHACRAPQRPSKEDTSKGSDLRPRASSLGQNATFHLTSVRRGGCLGKPGGPGNRPGGFDGPSACFFPDRVYLSVLGTVILCVHPVGVDFPFRERLACQRFSCASWALGENGPLGAMGLAEKESCHEMFFCLLFFCSFWGGQASR